MAKLELDGEFRQQGFAAQFEHTAQTRGPAWRGARFIEDHHWTWLPEVDYCPGHGLIVDLVLPSLVVDSAPSLN
jgi:hypothetical protein